MKLNDIQCSNYTAGETFKAILHGCTEQEICALNPAALCITTDDGATVRSYSYDKLRSVRHDMDDNSFEVVFGRVSDIERLMDKLDALTAQLAQSEQDSKLLKAQVTAATERSDFIEDCIAEMAAQVYND